METISRQPATKKTRIINSFNSPMVSPSEQMIVEIRPDHFLKCPDNPAGEEHQSHRERHVDVGLDASKKWLVGYKSMRSAVPPSKLPTPGISPIRLVADQDEDGGEEPEGSLDQMRPDDTFQKDVQTSTSHSKKF